GRASETLATGRTKSTQQTHHHRRALPLTPNADRRARHPHPQHDPPPTKRRHLRATHPAHPNPGKRARANRRLQTRNVVTTDPPPTGHKPSPQAKPPRRLSGTSG